MSAWTSFVGFVRPSSNGHAPQPTDPMHLPANLTVGQLRALEAQIIDLGDRVLDMCRVESRSVRRLFLLAQNVGKALGAYNVTPGEPVGNNAARFHLNNERGPWLELIVYPFTEQFVIRGASGNMNDQMFSFGKDADLTLETLLMLNGYAEFASRNAADQTAAVWVQTVNDAVAPVNEPVPVAVS